MTEHDSDRKLVPVAPVMVSQRTSEPVLGMTGRQFRELLREEGIPHVRRGKLVLARVADVVTALESKAKRPANVDGNRDRLRKIAGLGGGK